MQTLLLEEMTWPEIRDALAAGFQTVIIPAGSIEQHGYHLAVCTDAVLGTRAAMELANRLEMTLVAPVIRPGLSAHHMAMPGTLTLRPETFRMLVEDYVTCYAQHGFKTIILLGSHGGNIEPLEQIAQALDQSISGVQVITAPEVPDVETLHAIETYFDLPHGTNGGHADDRETSEMLATAPQHVRIDLLTRGYTEPLTQEARARFFRHGVTALTAIGPVGNPEHADARRGEQYLALTADALAALVKSKLNEKR
ncbi:MAG: creatininase family protein [Ruminococcaceae bacterium]|jgi:creatinine amidohydrolase|nr:creatininase family protein [Oscillospiraceae bacterium]